MKNQLEEGQIVLCTVEKIIGTIVFVKIEGGGEGTITTSEISPGRIRNLRDYVVPNKKIVCKVLRVDERGVHLSLRRVKQNEKKELLDKINKEKSYKSILKTVLKSETEKTIEKITKDHSLIEFFEQIKENIGLLENYINKSNSEKIKKIIESKKEKPKQINHIFHLSNKSSNGIKIIKEIMQKVFKNSECKISYLAAGKYKISIKGENFKKLKSEINQILETIEKQAKKQHCEFSLEKQ